MKIISIRMIEYDLRLPRFKKHKDEWEVCYTAVGGTRWRKNVFAQDELNAFQQGRRIMLRHTLKEKVSHVQDLRVIMSKMPNPVTQKELTKYYKDLTKFLKTNKC